MAQTPDPRSSRLLASTTLAGRSAAAGTLRALAWLAAVAASVVCHDVLASPIKLDEQVILFPTFASPSSDGSTWNVRMHGWIFEPERDSAARQAALEAFRLYLEFEQADIRTPDFEERFRAFLVDNERDKEVRLRLAGNTYDADPSHADGHFHTTVCLPADEVTRRLRRAEKDERWVPYEAITPPDDGRAFSGRVQFVEPTGLSIITDIDDTIKISEVADREALLRNTFAREFRAVEAMADLYKAWAASGARFHYVSQSPWQLYEPLSAFLDESGFPAGTFHLRRVRCKEEAVSELFETPNPRKGRFIASILAAFPKRKFILVGDSGQDDPEMYAELARAHPEQVRQVLIRDVTGEPRDGERYRRVFKNVPDGRWVIFRRPEELAPLNRP